MSYFVAENSLVGQDLNTVETSAKMTLGTIVRGKDPTYGAGEFIYLLGVTSQVVGNLVTYAPSTYQTALSANTANTGKSVAVAMAATTATKKYGWYQISGVAVVKKTAVAVSPGVKIFQSATTGRVMPTTASGKQILGAFTANAASVTSTTSTVLVSINRPHVQGQVA
jgi:hypothetical protein